MERHMGWEGCCLRQSGRAPWRRWRSSWDQSDEKEPPAAHKCSSDLGRASRVPTRGPTFMEHVLVTFFFNRLY